MGGDVPGKFMDIVERAKETLQQKLGRLVQEKVLIDPVSGEMTEYQERYVNAMLLEHGFEVAPGQNVLISRSLEVRPIVPREPPLRLDDRFAVRQCRFPNVYRSHAVNFEAASSLYMDKSFEVVLHATGRRWGMQAEQAGDSWVWVVYDL